MRAHRTFIVLALVGVIALALVLPAIQVCRDWAFIDQNTGSRKGYRDWSVGWRTSPWYQESSLETFMRSNHPADFRQRWISYAGTGRNLFGGATVRGHGRPSRIVLLKPAVINDYCSRVSDGEKRRLYGVFESGSVDEVRTVVDEIEDTVMRAKYRNTEPDASAPPTRPAR